MWKCGKRHGEGILKWDDGSYFSGLWNADERILGTMRMTNGTVRLFSPKNKILDIYWFL